MLVVLRLPNNIIIVSKTYPSFLTVKEGIFLPLRLSCKGRALKKVPVFGKTNKKAASYCTSEQFSDGQILNLFCLTQ